MKIISQHEVSPCLVCGNTTANLLQSEVSEALQYLQCIKCGWNVGIWLGDVDALQEEWDQRKKLSSIIIRKLCSKLLEEVMKIYKTKRL